MSRSFLARIAVGSFVAVALACGYDSTQPYGTPPGGQGSPPSDTTPAVIASSRDGLWTSSGSGPALLRLSAEQLTGHRNIVSASTITTPSASLTTLNSIAFDETGTLWVASESDDLLLAFGVDRIDSTRLSIATRVIAPIDSSISGPSSIAFDRQHRLWVANAARGTIVRFDQAQLAAGGRPVPAVTIEGIGHPASIAFDASGALWMSDNLTNRLFKFEAAKLAVSGGPAPDVVITAGTASLLKSPQGIAFDADGTLWVANPGRGNLVAYDATQQATSGPVVPSVTIALAATDAITPVGLAFDSTRALWVASADGSLAKLDRTSLEVSGQPAASVTLRVEQRSLLWSVAFWPKVKWLPLN